METTYTVMKVENGFLVQTKIKDASGNFQTHQWVAMNIDQLSKLFTQLLGVPK